ncbi:phage minor tail protein L [Allopusillimonas ginsengisoli]|uniref:phage minor tail protein L n=1 Tax=Allopusillimonas ginsengisoli TaxID=453575 RepID=UPI0010203AE6|nr:phage minor tail protein L [Allopusillimonas ginsengisoli]TEA79841.1 phage minor tail protein L [Allopusillimonas ginsengisoli]
MIESDIQSLTPGNLVTLFEIDCTGIGGLIERYHNHTDGVITWQGNEYYPWAIEARDFERTGNGQQPLPEITVGNIGQDAEGKPIAGVVTALCLALDDLVGAKVTRRRTFKKYLDAVNFAQGNPSADPNEHLPDEKWIISQKKAETPEAVTFVLTSPLQFDGRQLPSRDVIAGFCGWLTIDGPEGGYRGAYCGYTGTARFDKDGNPVSDPSQDKCGGRVSDCKKRFGQNKPLAYGGFASADRIR